jgi:hypothetical protein
VIGIDHRCKFYEDCFFADATSRTCTQDGGGDYCGLYRALCLARKLKEEEKNVNKQRRGIGRFEDV